MAQKDSGDGPSLEMPSWGFGRKKKQPRPDQGEEPGEPAPTPEPEPTRGAPLFAEEAPTTVAPPARTVQDPAARPGDEHEQVDEGADEPDRARPARRRPSLPAMPAIAALPAVLITGAVVGLLMVVLTWGALHLCELFRGTSTCGDPGFFLLLAILVVAVVSGSALLRAFGVPDPGSTSFLGVGLVSVVALLFLGDLLFEAWMVVVIPATSVGAFALSHWVTTAFVEPSGPDLHR